MALSRILQTCQMRFQQFYDVYDLDNHRASVNYLEIIDTSEAGYLS